MLSTFSNEGTDKSSVLEEKLEFTITDEVIDEFKDGELVGTGFGYLDDVREDNGKNIPVFPWLDSECCSLRHGSVTGLCAYSSTGKSMMACAILLH